MKYLAINYLAITFLLCFVAHTSYAVTDSLQTDTTKTTLTLASVYSSNANYYGQAASDKLPYALLNATVRFPKGFSLSAGTYKLVNYGSGLSEGDLGAGYDFNLSKKLAASVGYTRSFFPKNSPLIQAANENSASAALGYSWKWMKTNLSADYAFGKESDWFVTFSNSKEISLGSLFSENDYVSLEPAFELVGGTQNTITQYQTQNRAKQIRQILQDNPLANIGNLFPGYKEDGTPNGTTTTEVKTTSFDLLTYNLKLPLAYNRGNYVVEASCQLSLLGKKVEGASSKPRSFYNLSVYYQF
ncbi:MAG: hypothetical protein JWQ25_3165 [Daejeonella sp.]|nr:hypothetical protein [Daejeonella sp.]